ncbi:MAG TPA: AtpZ/AtpI family protein [Candidatus Saccharimonadales bacterium]|jgi:hypothetical protein|nr:AtpZ/AtpI family protein [Candidatus Saccharimonadales bacterium]
MKQEAAAKTTHDVSGDPTFGVGGVALAFLDTTWRIAVPVILFTIIGIYADLHLGTKPWLTLVSVVIGFVGAYRLVKKQIESVARIEKKLERKK